MKRVFFAGRVERVEYSQLQTLTNRKKERLLNPKTKRPMAAYVYQQGNIYYYLVNGQDNTLAENLLWEILLGMTPSPNDDIYGVELDVPTEFELSMVG